MNSRIFCNKIEKSCLTGSLTLFIATTGYKSVVMKISPFRTINRDDLKSQNFITAWSSTCGKHHQKKETACKAGQVKD